MHFWLAFIVLLERVNSSNWATLYKQGLNKWMNKALLQWCSWLSIDDKQHSNRWIQGCSICVQRTENDSKCLRSGGWVGAFFFTYIFYSWLVQLGPCVWRRAVNHSCRSSNSVVWPSHQRGRFPFQTGSELNSIPTIQRLSGDESEMTSHWFLVSELQGFGCMTLMAEVIMANVKLWPADFSGQTFPPQLSSHIQLWMCNIEGCLSWGKRPPTKVTVSLVIYSVCWFSLRAKLITHPFKQSP